MSGIIVIVGYKPKPGKEQELEALMNDHLPRLRAEQLVTDRESITMKAADGTVVEVFEWVSQQAIDSAHENPAVQKMWADYEQVCDYVPVGQLSESSQLFSSFTPIN